MLELRGFKRLFKTLDAHQRFLEACEHAALDCQWSITAAAQLAGVHRSAVYRWCKEQPTFRAEIDAAFKRGHDRWVREVYQPELAARRAAKAQRDAVRRAAVKAT